MHVSLANKPDIVKTYTREPLVSRVVMMWSPGGTRYEFIRPTTPESGSSRSLPFPDNGGKLPPLFMR
jgi:hypothetical protein